MASGDTRPFARDLERLCTAGSASGLSDAELVKRFTGTNGSSAELAFRALLDRHGPTVLGVCRHILRRPQDVDDAFQATILVFIRKARTVRIGDSLGPWLYGVAYRTATRARTRAASGASGTLPDVGVAEDATANELGREARSMLHEELSRLPEKYRSPIVLCHLEGKSHEEAARVLAWPVGTVSGRLSRGRQMLKDRLERRGLTASAGALLARLPGEVVPDVPARLAEATVQAALGCSAEIAPSTSVLTLTQGVIQSMFLKSLKRAIFVMIPLFAVPGVYGWHAGWAHARLGVGPEPGAIQDPIVQPSPRPNPQPATQPQPAAMPPMGGFGVPALPKNSPNLARDARMPLMGTETILLVESPDGRGVDAMSTKLSGPTPQWKHHPWPAGQSGRYIGAGDLLTFAMHGDTITELVAFDARVNAWVVQPLLHPVKEQINPIVTTTCALFQEGHNFYAFSTENGGWGVLKLSEDGGTPSCAIDTSKVVVRQGEKIYVFPIKQAKWSEGVSARPLDRDANPMPAGMMGGIR